MPIQRKQQVLAKIETSEGTAATLAGSDAVQIFDPTPPQDTVEVQTRVPAGPTLSRDFAPIGRQSRALSFRTDFRGSGSTGTAPDFARFLLASGYKQTAALRVLTLGSVTGIGFQIGEIVNQTSTNRGVVVGILTASNAPLHRTTTTGHKLVVAVITGTLGTAATTGESSGSTSTASAAGDYTGFSYQPTAEKLVNLTCAAWSNTNPPAVGDVLKVQHASSGILLATVQIVRDNSAGAFTNIDVVFLHGQPGFDATAANNELLSPEGETAVLNAAPTQTRTPSLTIRHNLDGRQRDLVGGRGDFTLEGDAGGPMQFAWQFSGDLVDAVDAPQVTTTGLSAVRPPRMLGAFLCYGLGAELYRLPTKRVSLANGGTVSPNLDGNRDGGSTGSNVADRDPTISVTVDNVNGAFDWELARKNGTPVRAAFLLGTAQGNIVAIVAPTCQVTELTFGEQDGVSTVEATLAPRRIQESGDDELYVAQL